MRARRLEATSRCPVCDLSALHSAVFLQPTYEPSAARSPRLCLPPSYTHRTPTSYLSYHPFLYTHDPPIRLRICRPPWLSPFTFAQSSACCPASSMSSGLVSIFLSFSGALYASPSPHISKVCLHPPISVSVVCHPRLTECVTEQ